MELDELDILIAERCGLTHDEMAAAIECGRAKQRREAQWRQAALAEMTDFAANAPQILKDVFGIGVPEDLRFVVA